MSNFLAIATVTAAISQLLESVRADIPGIKVTVKPPDIANSEAPPSNKLNIFLYQVVQNPAYRNEDLPARDSKGTLAKSPVLALNLRYLLTAHTADKDDLLAQQILASAMRILNENPVLSRDIIQDAISARQSLKMSDLADQIEGIRLMFQPLNLEDLSKLWSTFFQTNYRISVAYEATVVLLESKLQPKPTLPVKERLLYTVPFSQPVIETIEPQVVQSKAGAKILITGRNLSTKGVRVNFEGTEVTPNPVNISDERITVEIPKVSAGIKQVQVVHPMMLGSPAKEHSGYESNTAAFVLTPRITLFPSAKLKPGRDLTISFEPPATPRQKIAVLIGDFTIPVPPRQENSAPIDKVVVKLPDGISDGTYLLRIRVSGAESFLNSDDDPNSLAYGKYVSPAIEVKA